MNFDREPPEQLLDKIYDVATDSSGWAPALCAIADLSGSEGGVLYGFDDQNTEVVFHHNGRLSEASHEAFRDRHQDNPWSVHMFTQPEGALVTSDEILPLSELRRSAFYAEVLLPQQLAHSLMIPIAKQPGLVGAFNICRSARQGPFDPGVRRFFERLAPHLRRAMKLGLRMEGYRQLQQAEHQALDRIATGVAVLDRRGRIVFANRAFQQMARAGPLRIGGDGRLRSAAPGLSRRLEGLLRAAIAGLPSGTMALPHPLDGRAVVMWISSVRSQDRDRFADQQWGDCAAMVFVADPSQPVPQPTSVPTSLPMGQTPMGLITMGLAREAYGLTEAEARIAMLAASGHSVATIASHSKLSPNTVKTHLKRIFVKTSVRSQAELVRRIGVLRLVDPPPVDPHG